MDDLIAEAADQHSASIAANPGALFAVAAIAALVISVAAFALHQVGLGVGAASIALLTAGAAMSWLSAQARRARDAERIAH